MTVADATEFAEHRLRKEKRNMTICEYFNKNTCALVTGGAGFIGSHLSQALLQMGVRVIAFDDLSTGKLDNIRYMTGDPGFRFVQGSVVNREALKPLVGKCDIVFHLAAVVGAKLVLEDPAAVIHTNVAGSEAVMQAALAEGVKKVVIASSSEVYGKGAALPFREESDLVFGPTTFSRWAYAASKMIDEHLALACHHASNLPVVIFRPFNIIGPRQTGRYGMVVPRFIRQALSGESIEVYGDGLQTRCFLHVGDAVEAILTLAACPDAVGEVFNIGSTEEVSILDLARNILAMTRSARETRSTHGSFHEASRECEGNIVFTPYEKAYAPGYEDMRRRIPDISKIFTFTGWRPRLSLAQALQNVIRHFTGVESMATV